MPRGLESENRLTNGCCWIASDITVNFRELGKKCSGQMVDSERIALFGLFEYG
jgi:hypothetical protein